MRFTRLITTLVLAALATLAMAEVASAKAPYERADAIAGNLFEARSDLILDGGAQAEEDVADARNALSGTLVAGLATSSPSNLRVLRSALDDATLAVARSDEVALAAARGQALAALRHGAYDVAIDATAEGQVERARAWLLIRDFRQITRFTRPGVDATSALDDLEALKISADEAVLSVRKDLYDAYQARLTTFLDEADEASERDYNATLAESAALVNGYWKIISPEYEVQRSAAQRETVDATFDALAAAALRGDDQAFRDARDEALEGIDGFTAAPFTPEEEIRRAQQFIRFLDLVPVEYDRGTDDGNVTLAFEIEEAVAFSEAAQQAFTDLEPTLAEIDPAASAEIEGALVELESITEVGQRGRRRRLAGRDRSRSRDSFSGLRGDSARRSGSNRARRRTSTWSRSASTRWKPRSRPASASRPSRRAFPPTRSSSSGRSACFARSTRSSPRRSRATSGSARTRRPAWRS